jgi:hypothetical protein
MPCGVRLQEAICLDTRCDQAKGAIREAIASHGPALFSMRRVMTPAPNEIAELNMSPQQPIVIRGSGTTNTVTTWICAASVAGLLLTAAISFHRSGAIALLAAWMAALFGSMLLFTATQRVELNGDEISYQNLFKRRRSLRLDQIRSAQGHYGRSTKGGSASYLVIEPIDPQTPPMKIRMDFFSHADVQTIRNFFGDKLKRYGKKK